jgi:hypothetical protein
VTTVHHWMTDRRVGRGVSRFDRMPPMVIRTLRCSNKERDLPAALQDY